MNPSRAALARERVGLTLEKAAKRLRICPRYLRRVELGFVPSYNLAVRMAALYGCPMQVLLRF